jgi:plasmid stabilization system protein ParE
MHSITWTPLALADLWVIELWLDENATSLVTVRALSMSSDRVAFLGRFPFGGRLVAENVRVLRALGTPYLILHRPTSAGIEILRIRHERQDWQDAP